MVFFIRNFEEEKMQKLMKFIFSVLGGGTFLTSCFLIIHDKLALKLSYLGRVSLILAVCPTLTLAPNNLFGNTFRLTFMQPCL